METTYMLVGVDADGEEHAWYPCETREEAEARKLVAEEEFARLKASYLPIMKADDAQRAMTNAPDYWKMQGMKVSEFVIKEL